MPSFIIRRVMLCYGDNVVFFLFMFVLLVLEKLTSKQRIDTMDDWKHQWFDAKCVILLTMIIALDHISFGKPLKKQQLRARCSKGLSNRWHSHYSFECGNMVNGTPPGIWYSSLYSLSSPRSLPTSWRWGLAGSSHVSIICYKSRVLA